MQTFTRVALLATTAMLLSGCAVVPKYFAWLKPGRETPAVEVQPVRASTETASVDPAERLYRSAVSAIEDRDYGLALERLQLARERSPQDVRVLNALGVIYDKLGRFDLSARFYAEAGAVAPESPIVTANLAYSHLMQRKYDELRTAALTPGRQYAELQAPPRPATPDAAPKANTLNTARPYAVLHTTRKTLTLAKAETSMLKRTTPALVGRPLLLVDAGGGGAKVKTQLASLGWSVRPLIERGEASRDSRILYPIEHETVALALARTLPFRTALSVCADSCRGVTLVLGEDAKWSG